MLAGDDAHPSLGEQLDHGEVPGEVRIAADDLPCGPDQCGFQQLVVGGIPADPQAAGGLHDSGLRLDQKYVECGFGSAEAANALEAGSRQHPGQLGETVRRGDGLEAPLTPLSDETRRETLRVEEGRDPDAGV